MEPLLITNAKLAEDDSGETTSVLVENGRIAAVGRDVVRKEAREIDVAGGEIYPGFIDIHNHGAVGIDVNEADADGLLEIAGYLARHGVTAWLPTLVPDSDENYRRLIDAVNEVMKIQDERPVAQAVGVHYEGVFANEKMCGALRPQFFKKFTGGELAELPRLEHGVHMTTLAPEVEGGTELIRAMTDAGWVVSIGHTRCEAERLDEAFAAGARHMTHFFNAMTGVHHREVGVAGWGLANADVTFDIIADGIHVAPKMLELACRTKKPEKVSLISDSVAPAGLGDGSFELWGETITVEGGKTRNERGSIAGSMITMHDAVRRMISIGFTSAEVARMAAGSPAALIGEKKNRGSVEASKRADLVCVDEDRNISFVVVGGMLIEPR